jgi:hypothetical protein
MELTRYVRRGDNDGKRLFLFVGVGLEIALVTPIGVDPVLKGFRIIVFCKFFSHFSIFLKFDYREYKKPRSELLSLRGELTRYHPNSEMPMALPFVKL